VHARAARHSPRDPGLAPQREKVKGIDDAHIDRGEVTTDGTSVHISGPREWQAKIGKIPVAVA
jgi:hypothetical protein